MPSTIWRLSRKGRPRRPSLEGRHGWICSHCSSDRTANLDSLTPTSPREPHPPLRRHALVQRRAPTVALGLPALLLRSQPAPLRAAGRLRRPTGHGRRDGLAQHLLEPLPAVFTPCPPGPEACEKRSTSSSPGTTSPRGAPGPGATRRSCREGMGGVSQESLDVRETILQDHARASGVHGRLWRESRPSYAWHVKSAMKHSQPPRCKFLQAFGG